MMHTRTALVEPQTAIQGYRVYLRGPSTKGPVDWGQVSASAIAPLI